MPKSLSEHNCRLFRLEAEFDIKDFKKPAFLVEIDEKRSRGQGFGFVFKSTDEQSKEHSHLRIIFDKTESMLIIEFHSFDEIGIEESYPQPMEECIKWIGSFFKKDVSCDFHAIFEFDETFTSILPLKLPLITDRKLLAGAVTSGMSLDFPKEALIDRAIIQSFSKKTIVSLFSETTADLAQFDFLSELDGFSQYATRLVKPKEEQQ